MREVRKEDASGTNARFRRELLEFREARAHAETNRRALAAAAKEAEIERLVNVGLVADREHILKLTVVQLKDQIKIYRLLLKDEVLINVKMKDINLKAHVQSAVLAALSRNTDVILALQFSLANLPQPGGEDINESPTCDIDDSDEETD
ncbi:hypothetical protein ONZ45_g12885 [Pleurotus djamor]|nr:hypothetical protein ONZ45_g12885 [Pleurotus djamor]